MNIQITDCLKTNTGVYLDLSCGKFSATVNDEILSTSTQAMSDGARVLSKRGYSDDCSLIARHAGSNHDAMTGSLSAWRRTRVREDEGGPRFTMWEASPFRPVNPRARQKGSKAPAPTPTPKQRVFPPTGRVPRSRNQPTTPADTRSPK